MTSDFRSPGGEGVAPREIGFRAPKGRRQVLAMPRFRFCHIERKLCVPINISPPPGIEFYN